MTAKQKFVAFIFIGLVVLIILYKFVLDPWISEGELFDSSDATGGQEVRWAGDSYFGYFFLQSQKMRLLAPKSGFHLKFTDDGGLYDERLKKFKDGEYDFIVLPINEYLRHGIKYNFPGAVVISLCESKGADALLTFKENINEKWKVNDLNDSEIKIVSTPSSPSSFLNDLLIINFDLDYLTKNSSWKVDAGGSSEVYNQAKKDKENNKTRKRYYTMWEPDISRAVSKLDMKVVWGSDKFKGYIIDVLVFRSDFILNEPNIIKSFLKTYFRVLRMYSNDKTGMIEDMERFTGLEEEVIKGMIEKIDWFNFEENCAEQFGIPLVAGGSYRDQLFSSIIATSDVMGRTKTFNTHEFSDPFMVVNSSFLKEMVKDGVQNLKVDVGKEIQFNPLSDSEWDRLREVGVMRVEDITFKQGIDYLDSKGEELVDQMANLLINNYPNYRIQIRGHTGDGDYNENLKLSQKRSEIVLQRLIIHGINVNRLRSKGYANGIPPIRKPGESTREWMNRRARVEFVLLEGNTL
ncbi:MAG: phosphate ABC transporter substrate-binding/OmpA family protein [Nanoarchaeota archaeon]|nr:phosphate ABC transporter substrate-binding/OmpA family protein [Nanoarchaeota archaeon]